MVRRERRQGGGVTNRDQAGTVISSSRSRTNISTARRSKIAGGSEGGVILPSTSRLLRSTRSSRNHSIQESREEPSTSRVLHPKSSSRNHSIQESRKKKVVMSKKKLAVLRDRSDRENRSSSPSEELQSPSGYKGSTRRKRKVKVESNKSQKTKVEITRKNDHFNVKTDGEDYEEIIGLLIDDVLPKISGSFQSKQRKLLRAFEDQTKLDGKVTYGGFRRALLEVTGYEMDGQEVRIDEKVTSDDKLHKMFQCLTEVTKQKSVSYNLWSQIIHSLGKKVDKDERNDRMSHTQVSDRRHMTQKSQLGTLLVQKLDERLVNEAPGGVKSVVATIRNWGSDPWLHRGEFFRLVKKTGVPFSDEDCSILFNSLETNANGEINIKEFEERYARKDREQQMKNYLKREDVIENRSTSKHFELQENSENSEKKLFDILTEMKNSLTPARSKAIASALYNAAESRYKNLRGMFRQFDANKDGYLTLDEFTELVKQQKNLPKSINIEPMEAFTVFAAADANNDFRISFREFQAAFNKNTNAAHGDAMAHRRAQLAKPWEARHDPAWIRVKNILADRIALIMATDSLLFKSKSESAVGRAFHKFDANGDGVVDYDEFRLAVKSLQLGLSDNDITLACLAIDEDGDGEILYDEFFRAITRPEQGGGQEESDANELLKEFDPFEAARKRRIHRDMLNGIGSGWTASAGAFEGLTGEKTKLSPRLIANNNNNNDASGREAMPFASPQEDGYKMKKRKEEKEKERKENMRMRQMLRMKQKRHTRLSRQLKSTRNRSWQSWMDRKGHRPSLNQSRLRALQMAENQFSVVGGHNRRRPSTVATTGRSKDTARMRITASAVSADKRRSKNQRNDALTMQIFNDMKESYHSTIPPSIRPREKTRKEIGLEGIMNSPSHTSESDRFISVSMATNSLAQTFPGSYMTKARSVTKQEVGYDGLPLMLSDATRDRLRKEQFQRGRVARAKLFRQRERQRNIHIARKREKSDVARVQSKARQRMRFYNYLDKNNKTNIKRIGKRSTSTVLRKVKEAEKMLAKEKMFKRNLTKE
eukprot:g353.t1